MVRDAQKRLTPNILLETAKDFMQDLVQRQNYKLITGILNRIHDKFRTMHISGIVDPNEKDIRKKILDLAFIECEDSISKGKLDAASAYLAVTLNQQCELGSVLLKERRLEIAQLTLRFIKVALQNTDYTLDHLFLEQMDQQIEQLNNLGMDTQTLTQEFKLLAAQILFSSNLKETESQSLSPLTAKKTLLMNKNLKVSFQDDDTNSQNLLKNKLDLQ